MSAEAKPIVRKRSTSKTKKKKVVKASDTGSTSTSASVSEKVIEPRPPTRTVAPEKASEPRPPTRTVASTESKKEARQNTAHAQHVVKAESPPDDREATKEHANGHLEESADSPKSHSSAKTGRFEGKVVIITGSSAGIGRQAAMEFAQEGAFVTLHGQSEERLWDARKAIEEAGVPLTRILVVQGPIQKEATQREIIENTIETFGRIDVLVNNAGIMKRPDIDMEDMGESVENYEYIFAVNVKSVIQMTQLAVPYLEKTKGCIVNVSSIVAQVYSDTFTYYNMSKAALNHYSKDAAIKYAKKGIRVNIISPGPISTDFFSRHSSREAANAFEDSFKEHTLMERMGRAEEVTVMIRMLCSDEASFVTGAELVVDGGTVIKPKH